MSSYNNKCNKGETKKKGHGGRKPDINIIYEEPVFDPNRLLTKGFADEEGIVDD